MNGLRKCDTHTPTMEFYSAIRKNETMWFESPIGGHHIK
jgi:hypothetical protein